MLDLPNITFKEYQQFCLKSDIDTMAYIETNQLFNNDNDIEKAWALHLKLSYQIKEQRKQEYINLIRGNIYDTIDNIDNWSKKETKQYLKWLKNSLYMG